MVGTNWLDYSDRHIGMIHWNAYWGTYSLVLDVNDKDVTVLDSFGIINDSNGHDVKTHQTRLSKKDKFYTVQDFYKLNKEVHCKQIK